VARAYYSLIASLPALPTHFDVERIPITRTRLVERLKLLEPEDARTLDQLLDFLSWDRHPLERTDEEFDEHYDRLVPTIRSRLVQDVIDDRMDVRTIVSSLRRRRAGMPPPPGVGRLVDHIERHWDRPEFNLGIRFPWIARLAQLMDAGEALQAQRLLFEVTWRHWSRLAEKYHFSFEAVILYLARWSIIERWTSRDASIGRARFEQLITETLGEHANLHE